MTTGDRRFLALLRTRWQAEEARYASLTRSAGICGGSAADLSELAAAVETARMALAASDEHWQAELDAIGVLPEPADGVAEMAGPVAYHLWRVLGGKRR